jgi:hypothetical protein
MVDWNILLQTLITSTAVATAIAAVFKAYTEKRIGFVFEKKLKEYEAKLKEETELKIGLGKDRIVEYKNLSGLVQSIRKQVVDLYENANPKKGEISAVSSRAKELQELIYKLFITLHSDRVYERIHGYKLKVEAFPKLIDNERKTRDQGRGEEADKTRAAVTQSVLDIQSECNSIVRLLAGLISR